MSWLRRHATWLWLAALAVSAALGASLRPESGRPAAPSLSAPGGTNYAASAGPGDLAQVARQCQLVQARVVQMREQIDGLQTESAARRRQVAALDETLIAGSFDDCPSFLSEDATVRAFQRIIREAEGETDRAAPDHDRLNMAAAVARERLRTKFEAMRDQLVRVADDLDARAEELKARLHTQTAEVERLDWQVRQMLLDRSGSATTDGASPARGGGSP